MTTRNPLLRNVLQLIPLPLPAALLIACSGSAALDTSPPEEGDSELALSAARDGVTDKSQRDRSPTRHRHGGRHRDERSHPAPPPEPPGPACEVAGQTFPDGSAVPSGDSCNTCTCAGGNVACTRVACEPSVCAAFLEVPDGVCSRFPLDPCIAQDPDCVLDSGSCEAAGQTFPDGDAVPSGDSCNTCACAGGTVSCTEAACEPVVCALFLEAPDGVCSRFPLDPCIAQDPDCALDDGSCEAAGQTFPDGSAVPSGDSCNSCACNDGSVICTLALCEPVACARFLEAPDGVCSRFPLDPCKSQDPDCTEPEPPCEPSEPLQPSEP